MRDFRSVKTTAAFSKKILPGVIASVIAVGVQAQDIEEVLVTGIKSSLTQSVDVKRNSASVVDAISAEDIGKLPDNTIADSLQRIPGIQIRRTAGEGSTVNIRGMSQVSTLLNGEQFLSAGSITTIQPELSDVPAELLSQVDVLKSSQAKTLSAGVGGTIDLKTRRPLNMDEGWTFAGSAEASQGNYTDDTTGHKVSGFASFNNGEDFGVLVTVTNSDATMANYRYGMYTDWWFRGYNEDDSWPGHPEGTAGDLNGDGDTNDQIFGTIDYGITNKLTERERTGISVSAQYQLNDDVELIADVFHTKMDQVETINGLIADNSWSAYDWATLDPTTATNRGPSKAGGSGKDFWTADITHLDAPRVIAKSEAQVDERESTNINLQANVQFNDNLKASFRYIHGDAENNHTVAMADSYLTSGAQTGLSTIVNGVASPANPNGWGAADGASVPVTFDWSGEHPSIVYPQGFGQSINEYALVSHFSSGNYVNKAELDVLRADGTYEFFNDNNLVLDFGVRFADREVSRFQYDLVSPFTTKDVNGNDITVYSKWKDSGLSAQVVETNGVKTFGDTIGQTYTFTDLLDKGMISRVSDFGPASDGNSYYFINNSELKNPMAFSDKLEGGSLKRQDGAQSYVVEEQVQTAYFQANWDGELLFPYQANLGVQYVKTDLDISKSVMSDVTSVATIDGVTLGALDGVAADIIGVNTISRSDEDWLPRFNIGFDTSDDTKVRFAYTKTMMQMDANNLGLGRVYTTNNRPDKGYFEVTSASENGNPYLDPWRADNFDLSFEWYFAPSSMLSVGAFYVDVETSIGKENVQIDAVVNSDGSAPERPTIGLERVINQKGSTLQGLEVGFQQAFDFLPGAWAGLGTTINYTWTDSEGDGKGFAGESLPMSDNSENQVNAVLWYEWDQWQARVAYNYRSERFIGTSWNDGAPAAWWQAPTSYVDASVSYDWNDNVTVYVQGTNLTKEYEETYMQWSDVKVNQNIYEARYTLGIRAKF